MSATVLFVFTKHFPFGKQEQYLVDELPYLASHFDKLVFIPAEKFNDDRSSQRELPANCEILLLNSEAAKIHSKKNTAEFFSVFLHEWKDSRNKSWFWKERKRYASVLLHQQHLASVLKIIIEKRYKNHSPVFYAYWIHNSSIMLSLMKRRDDIKGFISRGHSIDLYEWDWVLTRYIKILPFYHFIIKNATRIAAISKHGSDYLARRFPEMKEKFLFSRLGVADSGINPYREDAAFTIVSCSNFSDNKRVDKIAEIISKMKTQVRWIHFGDGEGKTKTETIVKNFPQNCSAELRGFTPNEKIKAFYQSETVHLFVNMSEAEGIPVSLMEAISFGIPVLATAVYGNPEIANAETGFSVPFAAESAELAILIDNFAADREKQVKTRNSARQFYLQNFVDSVNYTAFAGELRKLL